MPFDDWQFYVVTLAAFLGLWALARPFLPSKRDASGACPGCGPAPRKKKRSELTVKGKKV